MKALNCFFLLLLFITSCDRSEDDIQPPSSDSMYFPSNTSDVWETESISTLEWNQNAIQPLLDFLDQKNTKSFMILVNGRIVMEEYFNGHDATLSWEWNSAGKTLVAT